MPRSSQNLARRIKRFSYDMATRQRPAPRRRFRSHFFPAELERLEERNLLAGIWISPNAVSELPTTGVPWTNVLSSAQAPIGVPNLHDQNENTDVLVLAQALAGVRLNDAGFISQVRGKVMDAVHSETTGGVVTFADPTAVETTVTFSAPGTYLLRLRANDGLLQDEDELTVRVHAVGDSFTPTGNEALDGTGEVTFTGSTTGVNNDPEVYAGADQVVSVADTVTIRGSVSDDGLPAGSVVTTWEVVPPRILAVARNTVSYVIAADLVGLAPEDDAIFRDWLRQLLTKDIDGRSLTTAQEDRPNNWGTMAAASRAAIAVYLGDQAELDRTAQVFKGFLGDRTAYAEFEFDPDPSWHADPAQPVGINPLGATKNGLNIDGSLPEEMRRGGPLQDPPLTTAYPWESLQGAIVTAEILHRAGYDAYEWQDRAILRAFNYLYGLGWTPPRGHDWMPWIVDARYGTELAVKEKVDPGKNMGWASWTHQFGPPDINRAPQVDAGPDQAISTRGIAALQGVVSDDQLPEPPGIATTWSLVSGPNGSAAQFADATSLNTFVHLSQPGDYVLRLTASDGELQANDEVAMRVLAPGETLTVSFQDGLNGYSGTRDAGLRADAPTTNFGANTRVDLDGSPDQAGLVLWDTGSLPDDITVVAASIAFNVVNSSASDFEVYESLFAWDEMTATFEQAAAGLPWGAGGAASPPDRASEVLTAITSATTGLTTFDLNEAGVAVVQKWIANPADNFGIVIQDFADQSSDKMELSTREAATGLRPKLSVTYVPADVVPPNHAPVLESSGNPALTSVPEDVPGSQNTGNTIATVFGSLISDSDFIPLKGVAVVGTTGQSNGNWEYSQDGGSYWSSLGTVSESSARLLADTARIRFQPHADFVGESSITVRAWDRTSGIDVADLTGANATGGSTAFSAAIETATITVTEVNDAPTVTLQNSTTAISESASTVTRINVADIVISDDLLGTNTLGVGGTNSALFEIDNGQLFLKAGTSLDFESAPSLQVVVSVDDNTVGISPDASISLTINVTDTNEPPLVALINATTSLPESTSTASRTKVADLVISDDALGTNALSVSGADSSSFEMDGNQLFLKASVVLDFETKPVLNVTVTVDDGTLGGTPDASAPLSISLTDANEPPSITLGNATTQLPESTDTSTRVKVADIVVEDDALGINALNLNGANAALFEIDGGQLFLKAATVLDFETLTSLQVTISVDDSALGGAPDGTTSLTITITDSNDPPSISVTNTTPSIVEDVDTGTRILVANIVISDDALGSNAVDLAGADAALFEVDGGQLFLKAGVSLDYELRADLQITLSIDDPATGSTPDSTASVAIDVIDINEPPSVAFEDTISTLSELADTSVRIRMADIAISDDALGTNSLSLSGADAAFFEIDSGQLFLKAGTVLNAAVHPLMEVSVFVDDSDIGGAPDASESLTIEIIVTNSPPSVALKNVTAMLPESHSTTARTKIANIAITDDGTGTNTLSLNGTHAALFTIDASQLFLNAGVVLDFETQPTLDVTVSVDDPVVGSTPDKSVPLTVQLTDVNEPPSILLANATVSFSEAVDTAARIQVADIVVSDDALGANNLGLIGDDAARFEIDNGQLFLKPGSVLDFESNPILDVTVTVDDSAIGTTPEGSVLLPITVTDVNEPPSVTLTGLTTTLLESTNTSTRIKVAEIVVGDDALGTNTLGLSGPDSALFEINNGQLFLKATTPLNFETKPALNVSVLVTDSSIGSSPDGAASLSIGVADVNEPPSVSLANATSALAETAGTAGRVKVADVVIADDALGTNSLSLSGADSALFEIDSDQLFLKADAALNFETKPVLNVSVLVDDNSLENTFEGSASLTITVTDVNEPPSVSFANAASQIAESTDTGNRVKVADIVISDDALGTNTLSLSGADSALFEISDGQLFLKTATALNFEATPVLNVSVSVNDSTVGITPDGTATLSLNVSDVNEPPSISLTNGANQIAEAADTGSRIKVSDINVADDALGTNALGLTGVDSALFEIDNNQLFLKAGATLDFETKPVLNVTVVIDDTSLGSAPEGSASLTINVANVNELPSVSLANGSNQVAESADTTSRIKIADIVISDDALGTNVLSLDGEDAVLFEIDNDQLFIKAGGRLDFETNPTLDVIVFVDDNAVGTSPDDTIVLSLPVTNANEPPSVTVENVVESISETANTSSRTIVADIVISDDALGTNTLSLSGADAGLFEIDNGQLFLKALALLDFETRPKLEVSVSVDDGDTAASPDDTRQIVIDVVDDPKEWQNPADPFDIIPDGFLVPQDALVIVNELNNPKFSNPVTRRLHTLRPKNAFFYDLNGDGFATPQDALVVINQLNRRAIGEGESSYVLEGTRVESSFPMLIARESQADAGCLWETVSSACDRYFLATGEESEEILLDREYSDAPSQDFGQVQEYFDQYRGGSDPSGATEGLLDDLLWR